MAKIKDPVQKQQTRHAEQDDTEYPPLKKVLASMAAIWLAFFVVALVRHTLQRKLITDVK